MNDDAITHQGVTYLPSKSLPPLTCHVETCAQCGGSGQMFGRKCKDCKGRGLISTPLSDRK